MNLNTKCDGANCISSSGEVRLIPVSPDPFHGNMILCRTCFDHEMRNLRESNHRLHHDKQVVLPKWNNCKVYVNPDPSK